MVTYIKNGQVVEKRGLWHSVQVFLLGVYLAIVTFFKTMFSLEAESQVKRRGSGPSGGPPGPPAPPRGVRGMGNLGGTDPHVSKCCGGGCG